MLALSTAETQAAIVTDLPDRSALLPYFTGFDSIKTFNLGDVHREYRSQE
jgi:hypothetical protein